MKLRRFLNVRPPLFVFGIMMVLGVALAISFVADQIMRWTRGGRYPQKGQFTP